MTEEVKLRRMILIDPELLENLSGQYSHKKQKFNELKRKLKSKLPPELKWINVKGLLHDYHKSLSTKNKGSFPVANQIPVPPEPSTRPFKRDHTSYLSDGDEASPAKRAKITRRLSKSRSASSIASPTRRRRTKEGDILSRFRPESHLKKVERWQAMT